MPVFHAQEAERWVETLPHMHYDSAFLAALAHQPLPRARAQWQRVALPEMVPHPARTSTGPNIEGRRAWLRIHYTPPADMRQQEPLAIYVPRIEVGIYEIWANDKLVADNVDSWRMQWNRPLYERLPIEFSRARTPIELMIAVPFRADDGYAISSIYVGPASAIAPYLSTRNFLQLTMPQVCSLVVLFMGLFSFQFWLTRRTETPHLLLALASIAWWVCNLQYVVAIPNSQRVAEWYAAIVDASISWVMLLIYLFALRFDVKRYRWVEWALQIFVVGITLVTLPVWNWQADDNVLQQSCNVVVGFAVTALITWRAMVVRRIELAMLSAALWLTLIFGAHDVALVSQRISPESIYLLPYGCLLVFAASQFAVQKRYVNALNGYEALSTSLAEKLAAREAELRANHQRLLMVERKQTLLLERQRLMRDMHDGIGSALMSSLVMVEQGRLMPDAVVDVLRECIDDLRLVIDSLEPIGHDLVTLLATLRYRLGRRLEISGLKIEWVMQDLPALDWLEPPQALQVLRIVQEVLTNVIKHALARKIRLTTFCATLADGASAIAVSIEDDGIGFTPSNRSTGRGLQHMRQRISALGGEIEIGAAIPGGTRVVVRLPQFNSSDYSADDEC